MPENTQKTATKRKAPKTAWAKGQSGNPGGRPPLSETQRLAREMRAKVQPELVAKLMAIIDDPATERRDAIAAVRVLLEELPREVAVEHSGDALTIQVLKFGSERS